MKSKNILIATQGLDVGGCETYLLILSKSLIKLGNNVAIVAKDGTLRKTFEQFGVKFYEIDFFNRKNAFSNIKIIEEILATERIDYLYIQPFYPMFEAVVASINLNIPYYLFFHGVSLPNYFDIEKTFDSLGKWNKVFLQNIAFKYAKKFIYVSDEVKDFYEKKYFFPSSKGILLNNSLFIDESITNNCPDFSNNFVIVSRIDDSKIDSIKIGIDVYIKYFELCKIQNLDTSSLKFDIVGDGSKKQELIDFIKDNKYNINYIGTTNNTQQLLQQYDVVFGMGRVLLEAISCKKIAFLITYNKFIGLVNSLQTDEFSTIAFANFSGRNLNSKDINTELDKFFKMPLQEKQDIINSNFNYILSNNNIETNIIPLVNDMESSFKYEPQTHYELKICLDLITHIDELNNLIDYKDFLLKNTQDSLAEEQKKSNHYRELLDNI